MRENTLRRIWAEGRAAGNCWLGLPSAYAAEIIAHQGWDSVTIDLQHGLNDLASMVASLTAVSTTPTVPLVRIPWNEPDWAMRALDAGAYGVICPTVNDAEECARFVGACRYAPQGYRSVGPNRALLYGGADYVARANETVLTIAQIETKTALDNLEAIVAVPGLDMVFVGPSDLGLSMGLGAGLDRAEPAMMAAIDRVLAVAKAAGRRTGIYCVTPAYASAMVARGFDLVTAGSDVILLRAGAANRSALNLDPNQKPQGPAS